MAGEILRKRREELNLTIAEVADALKIRKDYIEAIENDTFEKLPVAVYTKGYIRAYAGLLQTDAEPIIDFYSSHLSEPAPSTIIPVSSSAKKRPRFFGLAFVVVCALAAAFIVYMYGEDFFMSTKTVQQAGQRIEPAVTLPAAPIVMPPVSLPAQTPIAVQAPSVMPADHLLHISATELTWLSVQTGNGKSEEVTLRPGETKDWRFRDKAVLKVGNAGGIRVDLDEKTISPLGERGQVLTLVLPPGVE